MSKLLCNVLKISGGGQMPQMPSPLVALLLDVFDRRCWDAKCCSRM